MSHSTIITLRVHHRSPLEDIANKVANRAWTMDNVTAVEVINSPSTRGQQTPANAPRPAADRFDVHTPCMNIYSRPGTRVVFLGINGYEHEKAQARKLLTVGAVYVVKKTEVHSAHTNVWLEGFDHVFNSVQFGPESVLDAMREAA